MNATLTVYAKLLGLLVALTLIVGFNIAVWGLHRQPTAPSLYVPGGDPQRGGMLIIEHGCGGCHKVPGISSAVGDVGPRLDRMRYQMFVADILPNDPENLTRWIADPKQIDPYTAMPDLGVSDEQARHIATYLYLYSIE